ncbi:MAG: inositol-3-phosphate synthase [Nitrospirae bacterium]|nr:inositol-3-phosphate synthase [Nitrospirota bacterium]MBF0541706.1 inositol-3-phosphate synthase [Nitrospirota bacterium]
MSSKVGALIIGSKGAVATTLIAAGCAIRKGVKMNFRLPSEAEPLYAQLGLMNIADIIYGGWDIAPESYSQSCHTHGVVPPHIMPIITEELDKTDVYPAVLVEHDEIIEKLLSENIAEPRMRDINYTTTIFTKRPLLELIKSVEYDIDAFRKKHNLTKVIIINLASTEKSFKITDVHNSLSAFEEALKNNSPEITTGMIYTYAGIKNGCHVINFTPSISIELPAIQEFAKKNKVMIAGKDGKTGQTLYKTAIAPMLKHRGLKLTGWYSTNILGNRDGQVLHDPEHRATKIGSKSAVLSQILGYSDFDHQVHIHYYKPRGDAKEAWDNIDFNGWFDVPMQMKIDWLGDDSILAAPLVTDLIRWIVFFSDKGECGLTPQLASYFKQPLGSDVYDFFAQIALLKTHVLSKYIK